MSYAHLAGRRLSHPNICQFFTYVEDTNFDYLVFEYIPAPDLFTYYSTGAETSEPSLSYIMRQLVDAVKYCHDQGIVRMDLKLDNILIWPDTLQVKLIDFGLCDFISEQCDVVHRRAGSEEYCAPEVLSGKTLTQLSIFL